MSASLGREEITSPVHSCESNPSQTMSIPAAVPANRESMSSDGAVARTSRNAEPAVYVENMYNSDGARQSPPCSAGPAGWEAGRSSREVRRVVIERGPNEQIGIQISPAPAHSPPTSTAMTDASNAGTGTGTGRSVAAGDSASSAGDGCCCGASNGGVFVAQVLEGSLAERAGLAAGDQLLEVCGINLRNAQLTAALQILRQCTETVELLVQYNPDRLLASEQTAMQHNNNSLSAPPPKPKPNQNPNPNAILPPPHRSRSDSCFEQTPTQAAHLSERLKSTPKQQLVPEQQQQQQQQQTEQVLPNLSSSAPRKDACTATPESVECWKPTSRAVLCRSGSSRSVRSLQRNRQQHRDSVLSAHTRILEDSSEPNDFRVTLFANHEFRKLTN